MVLFQAGLKLSPRAEVTRCVPTLTQYLIMKMQLQDKFEEEIYSFIANIMSDYLSVVLAHYQIQSYVTMWI